jgi:hypothetical protein
VGTLDTAWFGSPAPGQLPLDCAFLVQVNAPIFKDTTERRIRELRGLLRLGNCYGSRIGIQVGVNHARHGLANLFQVGPPEFDGRDDAMG